MLNTQLWSFLQAYPFPALAVQANDLSIAGVNRATLSVTKATENEFACQNLFQLFTENKDQVKPLINRVMETKETVTTDLSMHDLLSIDAGPTAMQYNKLLLTPVMGDDEKVNLVICSFLPPANETSEQLKKQEEKQSLLDKAYRLAHIGIWEFDMQTHELQWSDITKEVHGFGPDYEPDVEKTINLFKEGINRQQFAEAARAAIEEEQPFDVELKIISGLGDERWIRAKGEPEYIDGVCTRFYGISQNVTDRRRAEEELLHNEQRFRSLVQDGSDMLAILDESANYKYVSPTSKSILGIPADDLIGLNALDLIHPNDHRRIIEIIETLLPGEQRQIAPFRFKNATDEWRWVETTLTNLTEEPAIDGFVANSRDVTDQKRQQKKVEKALQEKETLLAEIHHRVKNNLAVVSGMMQLQVADTDNPDLAEKLNDSIIRIRTMAGIHEQLYQASSFSEVELDDNIRSLMTNIQTTLQSDTEVHIGFDCEPGRLNINQAIPCSLIVNEVTTNIFKHAFPQQEIGHITVRLTEDQNRIHLVIHDNGIGLPDDFSENAGSLGMSLITVLSQQLEADYDFVSDDTGTTFHLRFTKDNQKGIGNSLL